MKFKLLTALTFATILMTGCSDDDLKKVSGTITKVECKGSGTYAYIQLDNGATYRKYGDMYCLLEPTTKVTIYHDKTLAVSELTIKGTEELKSKEE